MVRPDRARRAVRGVPKLARDLDRAFKEGIDDLRRILPLSRGGSVPDKSSGSQREGPKPLTTTVRTPESYARSARLVEGIKDVGRAIGDFRLPSPDTLLPKKRQRSENMNREDIIREIVNDPLIEITEAMLPIINDPSILMNGMGELVQNQFAEQFRRDKVMPKKKRKKSKYQIELGKQLKKLKKKHPRTPITRLMKRAHRATKKAMK